MSFVSTIISDLLIIFNQQDSKTITSQLRYYYFYKTITMKYSTPTFLALSMLASSAQADPVKIIEREQVVGPNMDSAHSWEKQIIGGEDAKENDFPYFGK